ncbi:MAG: biopolymer transporter ExbD [Flavobacteriaceae bacterium]|nr:biopolymer transporter ExbD [Flavobacteriaceae bacterium]
MRQKETPELNAGSMADIAFLLLIFFLVTTTLKVDQGIQRKLPRKTDDRIADIKEKNLLEVVINGNNELMVEGEIIEISQLTQLALEFIDNGSGKDIDGKECHWCQGKKDPASSDHPTKAVIAIISNRTANYGTYIAVLDNLNSAYTQLRNRYAKQTYQESYSDLLKQTIGNQKDNLSAKEKIVEIRKKYPLLISDSEIQN